MKLLLTSDLHQRLEKWGELVAAVLAEQPRFVLIAGDLLPRMERFQLQKAFFREMGVHFRTMKAAGPVTVLTYLGNDDAHVLEPLLEELQAEGLCVNLNSRVHREEGLVFCGMNKVRDYPFAYKHYCVPDGDHVACPQQLYGQGLTINEEGHFVRLPDLVAYLKAKPSLGEELARLAAQLQPGEMARSIWMVHQPPSDLGMDVCTDGRRVGSPTLLRFIREQQPLLGCSGHIHESPYQPGGRWRAQVGRTLWVQPGQMGTELHYARVELDGECRITASAHSVFGTRDSGADSGLKR